MDLTREVDFDEAVVVADPVPARIDGGCGHSREPTKSKNIGWVMDFGASTKNSSPFRTLIRKNH